jgi:hypothetical protein
MKPGTLCQLIISRDGRKIDAFAAGENETLDFAACSTATGIPVPART